MPNPTDGPACATPKAAGQGIDGVVSYLMPYDYWHDRYQDHFEAFGLFPGGGGFGVVNVDDEVALNQMILEMPFSWFSDVEIRPAVEPSVGWQQLQQAVQAMGAMA